LRIGGNASSPHQFRHGGKQGRHAGA